MHHEDVEKKSEKAKRRNCSSRFTRWAAEMAESTVTWGTKKVSDGISEIFEYGKPIAVFVITQLPQAVNAASYCFSMPGSNQTFRLDCCDQNQLSNLSRDLHLQGGAVPQLPHACDTHYNHTQSFGSTPWHFSACQVQCNVPNSTIYNAVDSIVKRNVQNGVWCAADTSATVGTTIGTFFALVIAGGCTFLCIRRRQRNKAIQKAGQVYYVTPDPSSIEREEQPGERDEYNRAASNLANTALDGGDGVMTSADGEQAPNSYQRY